MSKNTTINDSPKKRFVRKMFDDISGKYDLLNRVISFGLDGYCRKQTISRHKDDDLVLDICSGTGDMARDLMKLEGFNGLVIMGDFAMEMFKLTRDKLGRGDNVCMVICDAENLPFKNAVFDGVTCGFSLRNLGDLKQFGGEVSRILGETGKASIVDVSHPPNPVYAKLFYIYFYKLIPLLSRLFTKKKYAYKYLPVSLRTFLKQDEVVKALSHNGTRGSYRNLFFGSAAIYYLDKSKYEN